MNRPIAAFIVAACVSLNAALAQTGAELVWEVAETRTGRQDAAATDAYRKILYSYGVIMGTILETVRLVDSCKVGHSELADRMSVALKEWGKRNRILDQVRDVVFEAASNYGGDVEVNRLRAEVSKEASPLLEKKIVTLDECLRTLDLLGQGKLDPIRRNAEQVELILGRPITTVESSGAATSEMYAQGLAAFEKSDYETALRVFTALAKQGERAAQTRLGVMHEMGLGPVKADQQAAVRWYLLAAGQGDAEAQTRLAAMYEAGKGTPQDYEEAAKWYRKASDQGETGAYLGLGLLYERGAGVQKDYVQAYKWFNLAAASIPDPDSELGRVVRSAMVQLRDRVAEKMTREQILEGQRLAREWNKTRVRPKD